jgi:16S rRNA (cytosine1402-N4)-methyltransferase
LSVRWLAMRENLGADLGHRPAPLGCPSQGSRLFLRARGKGHPSAATCGATSSPSSAGRPQALDLTGRTDAPEVSVFLVESHIMDTPTPIHVPVLLDELLDLLQPPNGGVIVDGTLGGGGHARALAQRVGPAGMVIALDRDSAAVAAAGHNLADLPVKPVQANFCDLPEVLAGLGIRAVAGVVLDLGISSDQLADPQRGFSFLLDGPLDLRFDPSRGEPARRLVNRLSAEHLADLIYHYGEERYSRRIAAAIVQQRRERPIETSGELAELVRRCVPRSSRDRIDPATRTFQALRIAVNDELKSLEIALRRVPDCLEPGGRFVVISFHSLEDRRVKEAFRDDPRLEVVVRKPVRPSAAEVIRNPRSRSAKLRVAVRRGE